jgi:DNA polymerase I-like protein with 3'-5' exonuclease and polymerase domains
MYQIALKDPHQANISLKPSAERLLGLPPDEQEEVIDWLVANQPVLDQGITLVRTKKPNPDHPEKQYAGAYIVYAPGSLVAKYAIGDVVRTGLIHQKLYPEFQADVNPSGGPTMITAYERELRLMPYLLENERRGMRVDTEHLELDIELYQRIKKDVEAWIYARLDIPPFPLTERDTLARILDEKGLVTDWVLTKKGKKSTSKKNMTLEKITDKELYLALGYVNRLQTVLSQSLIPWLEMAKTNNGYIFTSWNQVRQEHGDETKGTRTFRLSCSRFMNITKDWYDKGDYTYPEFLAAVIPGFCDLPTARSYILPDPGCLFGHRDYNQQEFRIVAHYEDDQLKDAYRENPKLDMHNLVRDLILKLTGHEYGRREVKILNFGELYGMGLEKIAAGMKTDIATAKQLKATKRKAIPGVAKLDNEIKRRAKNGLPIREWGGGLIYCEPASYSEKHKKVMSWEYKMFNYLIQRSAASCTKEAVIRYHEHKERRARFMVTVHDEINASMPIERVMEEMQILRDVMASIEFDVPMLSDGKFGPNWGSLKEKCA